MDELWHSIPFDMLIQVRLDAAALKAIENQREW